MCEYTGHHFGANYEDACCIDGFLWDLDSGDSDGFSNGGFTPCPSCNTVAWLDDAKLQSEETSWGANNGVRYCGAMLIKSALKIAEQENSMQRSTC